MTVTPPKPLTVTVSAGANAVYITYDETEYLVLPPRQARELAASLLTNADLAEDRLPAEVYTVDRR